MNPPRSPNPDNPQVYDPNSVFDATLFGDPPATQVPWRTMAEFRTEFQTRSFHQESPHHIELRPTVHALTKGLLSLALGTLIGGWAIGSSLLAGELEFQSRADQRNPRPPAAWRSLRPPLGRGIRPR